MYLYILPLVPLCSIFTGSRSLVLEAKQQVVRAEASLHKAVEQLEDYSVKLEKSSSDISSANSTANIINAMVEDSEQTGWFLNGLNHYI